MAATRPATKYDDAKNEQAFAEGRICELESILVNVTVAALMKNPSLIVS